MNKESIIQLLMTSHSNFVSYLGQLPTMQLQKSDQGKWNALQQADHIKKSLKPLAQGLMLPNFVLKLLYGRANRPSKTYQQLVDKYNLKLQAGGTASAPFVPQYVPINQLPSILRKIEKYNTQICKRTAKRSETALDEIVAPHPLLGKVTLREMLFFTAYHVQHHQQLIKQGITIAT
jgi:hypothetical protein